MNTKMKNINNMMHILILTHVNKYTIYRLIDKFISLMEEFYEHVYG